jgi:hypothetical protein
MMKTDFDAIEATGQVAKLTMRDGDETYDVTFMKTAPFGDQRRFNKDMEHIADSIQAQFRHWNRLDAVVRVADLIEWFKKFASVEPVDVDAHAVEIPQSEL